MMSFHDDPTPQTPFLRSDCDGQCETIGYSARLRSGHSHHHHHHHKATAEPSTSSGFIKASTVPSVEEENNRINLRRELSIQTMTGTRSNRPRKPSTSSSHGSNSSHVSQKEWEKIKRTLDIDDPKRTDYTYSYSNTYRNKPPTPDWLNPKMSRRSLHGRTFFTKSSSGISLWNLVCSRLFWWKRRDKHSDDEMTEEAFSDEEIPQPLPNGHIEDTPVLATNAKSPEPSSKHQFRFFASAVGSALWIATWVLSSISALVFWPVQKLSSSTSERKVVEENSVDQTKVVENWEREDYTEEWTTPRERDGNRRRGCCGPLFFCFLLPLLCLLLLGAAWKNEDSNKFIRLYVFPLPFVVVNRTRESISLQKVYNFFHYSPSDDQPGSGQNAYVPSEISKAEFLKLQQSVKQLESKLEGLSGKCCKQPDLANFVTRTDFDTMIDESGDLRKLRSDVRDVGKQVGEMSGKIELSREVSDKALDQLKQELASFQAKLGDLATNPSDVMEKLASISGLLTRMNSLEGLVGGLDSSVSTTRKDLEIRMEADRKEMAHLISQHKDSLEKSWKIELNGLLESVKTQETRLHGVEGKQDLLSVRIEDAIRGGMQGGKVEGGVSLSDVNGLIAAAIMRYDMDKTGMADHAMEPAGGSVLSIRCSETYSPRTRKESIFGIPIWYSSYSPRVVIQPGVVPGECWAFKGSSGFLLMQLSGWIEISGFAYEHIPKAMSPDGHIESAPKEFEVLGLKHEKDTDGILLGKYVYDQDGDSLQHFPIQASNAEAYPIVELKILSNHGNPVYTCLYRFRVHGRRVKPAYGVE